MRCHLRQGFVETTVINWKSFYWSPEQMLVISQQIDDPATLKTNKQKTNLYALFSTTTFF